MFMKKNAIGNQKSRQCITPERKPTLPNGSGNTNCLGL